MSEKEKQEHRLSKRAIGILSDKYYNNIYGRFKDNDITLTNEEKELMTVFIQLYFKYNISNLEANILELEEWCHQNNDSKPRYLWKMPNSFRNLNSDDEKLKKETKLANFIRMLKTTSYYNNAYEKYYNGRYDELSVYELSSMQLFDSLIKKYDISKLESFILELEEWCRENNDGKPIYYYRMPRHLRGVYSAKDKLSENEDQREYRLHQTIQSFKRGVSFNNVYANYFDNNQKNNITPKEKELVERYLIIEKKYNYSQLELLIIDLEDFCNTYNRFPRGIHNITLTNKYFETELQREKRLYNAIINIKRGAYSNLYERYNNQILTQEELDFMNRFSELEKNYKNSVKIKVIKK